MLKLISRKFSVEGSWSLALQLGLLVSARAVRQHRRLTMGAPSCAVQGTSCWWDGWIVVNRGESLHIQNQCIIIWYFNSYTYFVCVCQNLELELLGYRRYWTSWWYTQILYRQIPNILQFPEHTVASCCSCFRPRFMPDPLTGMPCRDPEEESCSFEMHGFVQPRRAKDLQEMFIDTVWYLHLDKIEQDIARLPLPLLVPRNTLWIPITHVTTNYDSSNKGLVCGKKAIAICGPSMLQCSSYSWNWVAYLNTCCNREVSNLCLSR